MINVIVTQAMNAPKADIKVVEEVAIEPLLPYPYRYILD